MNRFKQWLRRALYGIYGFDKLYFVLFGTCMFFMILNLFVRFWGILLIETLILVYMMFRVFSHNIVARRRENDVVMGFFKRIRGWFKLQKSRFRDRKTHVYKKCPKCGAILRLPKRDGVNIAGCPRCKNKFEVKG